MARTRSRNPLPEEFVTMTNEMAQAKIDYEEFKEAYLEYVVHLMKGGFTIAQLAEISPFSYASLRNWTLQEKEETA